MDGKYLMKIISAEIRDNHIKYYFCGVRVFKIRDEFSRLQKRFSKNKNFDTHKYDLKVENLALKYAPKAAYFSEKTMPNRVAFLATRLYNSGGHSKCIDNVAKLLSEDYQTALFLTQKKSCVEEAKTMLAEIAKHTSVVDTDVDSGGAPYKLQSLFKQITEFSPKVLFVYIHTNDVLAAALLALLKKYTNIKIFYSNHSSHKPALGFRFADIILEGMPSTLYFTHKFRKHEKCTLNGLYGGKKENIPSYNLQQVAEERANYGIAADNYFTLSGGASYKFFEGKGSAYFEMIRFLLIKEPKLIHVIATKLSKQQQELVEGIFKDRQLRKRLIIVPFLEDYLLTFKSCDVYIDSFPVGGALTHIDLMKIQTPTVVKINSNNAVYSFHEYLPADYAYMYEDIDEMVKGIVFLLHNQAERSKATAQLYRHYLKYFEAETAKKRYVKLIENSDNLTAFYDQPNLSNKYNFGDLSKLG